MSDLFVNSARSYLAPKSDVSDRAPKSVVSQLSVDLAKSTKVCCVQDVR